MNIFFSQVYIRSHGAFKPAHAFAPLLAFAQTCCGCVRRGARPNTPSNGTVPTYLPSMMVLVLAN